jgi:hypothetical protein
MKPVFITLTEMDLWNTPGPMIDVNAAHLIQIRKMGAGSSIRLAGLEYSIEVAETPARIRTLIKAATMD